MKTYGILTLALFVSSCGASVDSNKLNNRCELEPRVGQCRAYFPNFYFNVQAQVCEEFIWGGCGGVVPFETLRECQSSCETSSGALPSSLGSHVDLTFDDKGILSQCSDVPKDFADGCTSGVNIQSLKFNSAPQ